MTASVTFSVPELQGKFQRALNLLQQSDMAGEMLQEMVRRQVPIRLQFQPEESAYAAVIGVSDDSGSMSYHLQVNLAQVMNATDSRLAGQIGHEIHHLLKEILDPEGWVARVQSEYPHLSPEDIHTPGPDAPRGTIHGEYKAHEFEMLVYEELNQKTGEAPDPYMADFRTEYDKGEEHMKTKIRESEAYAGLPEY